MRSEIVVQLIIEIVLNLNFDDAVLIDKVAFVCWLLAFNQISWNHYPFSLVALATVFNKTSWPTCDESITFDHYCLVWRGDCWSDCWPKRWLSSPKYSELCWAFYSFTKSGIQTHIWCCNTNLWNFWCFLHESVVQNDFALPKSWVDHLDLEVFIAFINFTVKLLSKIHATAR